MAIRQVASRATARIALSTSAELRFVENAFEDEGLAMHWHGLYMKHANEMDGAVGMTQDPIAPGSSFEYRFRIANDQHGTFWTIS